MTDARMARSLATALDSGARLRRSASDPSPTSIMPTSSEPTAPRPPYVAAPEDAWLYRGTGRLAAGLGLLLLGLTAVRLYLGLQLADSRPAIAAWVAQDTLRWITAAGLCLAGARALRQS